MYVNIVGKHPLVQKLLHKQAESYQAVDEFSDGKKGKPHNPGYPADLHGLFGLADSARGQR
ncbi:hypothetical protein [Parazoarcus communis]|uniref:hypothetical protein n=1 Tax=Parazoarcus communis TaxID=41977 RepID=UPI001403B4E2|nr:hypothetical protein [Parazoarcus communis]